MPQAAHVSARKTRLKLPPLQGNGRGAGTVDIAWFVPFEMD